MEGPQSTLSFLHDMTYKNNKPMLKAIDKLKKLDGKYLSVVGDRSGRYLSVFIGKTVEETEREYPDEMTFIDVIVGYSRQKEYYLIVESRFGLNKLRENEPENSYV